MQVLDQFEQNRQKLGKIRETPQFLRLIAIHADILNNIPGAGGGLKSGLEPDGALRDDTDTEVNISVPGIDARKSNVQAEVWSRDLPLREEIIPSSELRATAAYFFFHVSLKSRFLLIKTRRRKRAKINGNHVALTRVGKY